MPLLRLSMLYRSPGDSPAAQPNILPRRLAAVHEEASAGYVGGLVRGQEQDAVGYLTRRARAIQHRPPPEFIGKFFKGFAGCCRTVLVKTRQDRSWADGVYSDTLHGMDEGHAASEPGDGGLGGIVLHHVAAGHEGPL